MECVDIEIVDTWVPANQRSEGLDGTGQHEIIVSDQPHELTAGHRHDIEKVPGDTKIPRVPVVLDGHVFLRRPDELLGLVRGTVVRHTNLDVYVRG